MIQKKDLKELKKINFLNLLLGIEKGIITICFKIGTFLSGPRKGEIHNHGIDFAILENDLKEIYELALKKQGYKLVLVHYHCATYSIQFLVKVEFKIVNNY